MTLTNETSEIVLLYPKTGVDVGGHTVAPPHAVLAVAAPLYKERYKITIIDMRRDNRWRDTLRRSVGSNTICIGVSTMTGTQVYFALMMAAEARRLTEGRIPIVWGGAHPSILPEQTLENDLVDIVVRGEGEITFYELVKALENKQSLANIRGLGYKDGSEIIMNETRPFMDVNDLLPVPWDLINVEEYICADNYFLKDSPRTLDIGQTSRGCPHRCGFCCSSSIQKKRWRAMKVDRALETILEPVKRFKLTGVWIRDDEFYVHNRRAFEICEGIVKSGHKISWYATGSRVDDFNNSTDEQLGLLKSSGGRITKFGAESGSDRILDLIQKGFHTEDTLRANQRCKKHGIVPAYSLIIGFPTETFEEINTTIDFGYRLQRENPAAQLETLPTYTAFPCTPMWDLALAKGLKPPDRLEGWVDWIMDDYDFEGAQIPWFNPKERKWIGNITYMSILSNCVENVGNGIQTPWLRGVFKGVLSPLQHYYRFRLRNKLYKTVPEFAIARKIRRKLFYRNEKDIK